MGAGELEKMSDVVEGLVRLRTPLYVGKLRAAAQMETAGGSR